MKLNLKIIIGFLFLAGFLLFSNPIFAAETTLYFGSVEKVVETGEQKVYISAGNATAVKSIKGTSTLLTYLHSDPLNSTVLTTNSDGTKNTTSSYYPYGNETVISLQGTNDKLYTGQRKDFSSDLYFYNARYYNPKIGNFISADKAQGPNRYAYVGNNPIMRNDPSGNCFLGFIGGDCSLPSGVRQGTPQDIQAYSEGKTIDSIVNKAGPAIVVGAIAQSIANANIPIISSIAGRYAYGSYTAAHGLVTNNQEEKITGVLEAGAAADEALLLGMGGKAMIDSGSALSRYGAWQLYQKVGNQELNPAMKAQMMGNYEDSGVLAENVFKEKNPNFNGFREVPMSKNLGGLASGEINESMASSLKSSLKIHETSHQFDPVIDWSSRGVHINSRYGLYAQQILANEGKAYLAEYASGGKSLRGVIKGYTGVSSANIGGFFNGLKSMLFERN